MTPEVVNRLKIRNSQPTIIRVEGERVIWDRFEQPRRKNWDYSDFGPFIFPLDEYKREIQKVPFIKKLVERSQLSYWD